ncbi:MAG: hypothetical protein ABL892_10595 [Thiobacillaceae bacterium]
MPKSPKKDLVEIFGYAPNDTSLAARTLWDMGACPFIAKPCSKANHDGSIIYGTCSVTSPYGDCIVCPNRLYENNYQLLRKVATDAFGDALPCLSYEDYIHQRTRLKKCVVILGQNSGKEVKLGRSLSMDWILALVDKGRLVSYVGIEAQSIDITGNYRDCWYAYKNTAPKTGTPPSEHGLNWANVHKRLIPQIIRKGLIYSRSTLVKSGLYFIVPDIVYQKFEDIIGADIPAVRDKAPNVLTVHTYALSPAVKPGAQRKLQLARELRFTLDAFSERFIGGANLPSGADLDQAVRRVLGLPHP